MTLKRRETYQGDIALSKEGDMLRDIMAFKGGATYQGNLALSKEGDMLGNHWFHT